MLNTGLNTYGKSSQSWADYLMDQHAGVLDKLGVEDFKHKAGMAWSLLTQDEETMRRYRSQHTEKGAARSAMGSPDQIKKRERIFAERSTLETMYANREVADDIILSKKLYEFYLEE